MSYALDVNILLYASDSGGEDYQIAREFLEECMAGPEVLYLGWPTIMGYLRMATHPRIFARPLGPIEAESNIDSLLQLPHVRVLANVNEVTCSPWRVGHAAGCGRLNPRSQSALGR